MNLRSSIHASAHGQAYARRQVCQNNRAKFLYTAQTGSVISILVAELAFEAPVLRTFKYMGTSRRQVYVWPYFGCKALSYPLQGGRLRGRAPPWENKNPFNRLTILSRPRGRGELESPPGKGPRAQYLRCCFPHSCLFLQVVARSHACVELETQLWLCSVRPVLVAA